MTINSINPPSQYPSYNPFTGQWSSNQGPAISNQQNIGLLGLQGYAPGNLQGIDPNLTQPSPLTGSIRPGTSNGNVNVYGNHISLPHPTGIMVQVALYQNGAYIAVTIDQAYAQIIQDINQLSNTRVQYATVKPKHQFMPEGDFSLDEMSRAEEILAELN